mmetsp:Transcript_1712/g.3605  ORF Transcript_1712/g.3605 Transcript_1712/m.3605 type:complete len:150 (-) Transcript_1712:240-689(-)
MSLQQCRMTVSRIVGRQVNLGSSILSRSQKSASILRTPSSIRRYAVATEPSTMVCSQTRRYDFFLSLRDLASSILVGGRPAGTTVAKETSATQSNSILNWAIWLIKRTYQPSLLKKKRQCGYMKRKQTVGGRRILKRRKKKGRKRLFGA